MLPHPLTKCEINRVDRVGMHPIDRAVLPVRIEKNRVREATPCVCYPIRLEIIILRLDYYPRPLPKDIIVHVECPLSYTRPPFPLNARR